MFKPNSNRPQQPPANKQEESTGPTRLAQLWNEPSLENLQTMMNAGKKNPGCLVEQPFSVTGQDSLFQLCVTVTDNADPIWKFSSGTLNGMKEVWTLPSIDVGLIHNLVVSESTGQQTVDLISAASVKSQSTTGTFSLGRGEEEPTALNKEPPKFAGLSQMQSLALTKMTGRLEITGKDSGAEIFVVEGRPMHATTGDATGDNAIVELLSWETGKFRLLENQRPAVTTVSKRLETLLMEGATLQDQHIHLNRIGLNLDAFLIQPHANLSEMHFEQIVRTGPPCNMQMLKDLYMEIDGHTSLFDLLRRMPLTKAEWIPLLFNLTQVGLVTVSKEKPTVFKAPETRTAPDVQLDETSIQSALRPLLRVESEIFTYPIFQYLVKQEVCRFDIDSKPLALVVFDLFIEKEGAQIPLPLSAVKAVMQRLKEMIRPIDIIGHFETLDYALLLPQTTGRSATVVAQRMSEKLKSAPFEGLGTSVVNACFGVAAVPQDTTRPGGLIVAANEAQKNARKNNLLVVEYRTMS